MSFAGHLHATEHHYLGEEAGFAGAHPHHHHVLTAACGSWWSGQLDHRRIPSADSSDGTPNGFHLLSVSDNHYATRFVPAITKPLAQLRVVLDGHRNRTAEAADGPGAATLGLSVPQHDLGRCRVVVNVFDGGPKTRVSCEIVGRSAPAAMHMASIPDPLIRDLFAGKVPRKAWVQAVASSHIWEAPLPPALPAGAHVLEVRACDEYGRDHVMRTVIEVTATRATPSASL